MLISRVLFSCPQPPGRSFGVVHQLAYHGELEPLQLALDRHPRIDLRLRTKQGKTVEEVATEEGASAEFREFLRERIAMQVLQECVSAARDGEWVELD